MNGQHKGTARNNRSPQQRTGRKASGNRKSASHAKPVRKSRGVRGGRVASPRLTLRQRVGKRLERLAVMPGGKLMLGVCVVWVCVLYGQIATAIEVVHHAAH